MPSRRDNRSAIEREIDDMIASDPDLQALGDGSGPRGSLTIRSAGGAVVHHHGPGAPLDNDDEVATMAPDPDLQALGDGSGPRGRLTIFGSGGAVVHHQGPGAPFDT